ncbi:hypothetical protein KC366_g88 [Hortaea werneckii]|nr:hypothetical protein KC366_g88 [Hortaea werneckii]
MFLGFAFLEEGSAAAEKSDADEEEAANHAADDYACDLAAGEAVIIRASRRGCKWGGGSLWARVRSDSCASTRWDSLPPHLPSSK